MKRITIGLLLLLAGAVKTAQAVGGDVNPELFPVIISTYSAIPAEIAEQGPEVPASVSVEAPAQLPPPPEPPQAPPLTEPASSLPVIPEVSSPLPAAIPTVEISLSTAVPESPVPAAVPPPLVAESIVQTAAIPAPPVVKTLPALKPLSLDLREMDIVDVLKMLSRQSGINIVVARNVAGRVTAFFNNVEFWEAFRTLLSTRDLAYAKEGDLIQVMAAADYERLYGVSFAKTTTLHVIPMSHIKARTAKAELEPVKSKVGMITVDELTNSLWVDDTPEYIAKIKERLASIDVPQVYKVFRLNFATAEDLLPKIASLASKDTGNLQVDKRSNTIIVQDNPARVKEIEDIIQAFDVRHRAVLIEAKIVQVTLNKSFQWGINWQGINWSAVLDKIHGYHLTGQVVQNLLQVPLETVNGPNVTARGITASVGIVEKPNFNAVVNFLNTVGNTNLLSSPRVMALDNQEARIHVGSKVAKITRTLVNPGSNGTNPITTENVEFLDVGVKLAVTPSIGNDGTITMKVKPAVSSVESTITTSEGSSIPVIRVSEAEASLVVKDGITVVLGGLIEDSRAKTDTGVPILSKIPLLGYLFRSRDKSQVKTELVIFLTPHIVTGETVSPEAQERFNLEPTGAPKKKRGFFRRLFGKKNRP